MPSSLSGSSSESSGYPAQTKKKRQVEVESSDSSDTDNASNASSADKEDSEVDAPQSLPSTEIAVLSHAERRRQKKRQKRQLAAGSDASPRKQRKLDDSTSSNVDVPTKTTTTTKTKAKNKATPAVDDPRRQKRQNSVWVGNLSFRTTQDALQGFFHGVGTITRIHMPMRRGKQVQAENMGFAYVDFDTPEAKVIAITLSEGQLDGRNLLIKDGGDFTGRPAKVEMEPSGEVADAGEGEKVVTEQDKGLSKTAQKILRAQKQPPAPTLFLGNLGFETTEESIRELFEAHRYWGYKGKGKEIDSMAEKGGNQDEGEGQAGDAVKSENVWIRKIRMGTFEDSGTCKGFAFIDFTRIEHATEALINPRNHRLNGRDLVVEYASPDAVRRGGGPRHPRRDRDQKGRSGSGSVRGNAQQKASMNAPYTKQRRSRHIEQEDDAGAAETPADATVTPRSRRPDRVGHDQPHIRRAKPGAALAHAQRQSAAILPSQGQKIVF